MRTRIVGLSTLAAILAIALFGVPLAAIVVKYSIDDEHGELERVAEIAAVAAAVRLDHGLPPHLMTGEESGTRLAVYDAAGRRLVGDGPPEGDPSVAGAALGGRIRSFDAGGELVVAVPIRTESATLGVVRASTPSREVYGRIAVAWMVMVGLAVVDVLAVWLIARRLAARLNRPLEDLADTAHELGAGDFTVRFRDTGIGEIDSVATALNGTAAQLSDLVARERAFSADASHQLRTPLTVLQLGLEVALEDPEQDPKEAIGAAIASAERLRKTVEDLLSLARDSTQPGRPLAIKDLLEEISGTWRPQLTTQGRELDIRHAPGLPGSGASEAAVRQILAVLVDNAVTHGAGRVTVTLRNVAGVLGIDVADQGPGITQPSEQLFTRRQPDAAGNGIGLALARRLAEAEGGRLRLAKPAPPTFTVLLPPLRGGTGTPGHP